MLKTSLIKFIFVNIACISCSFKFLNSFFIFSKWPTSIISKSWFFYSFLYTCSKQNITQIGTLLNGVSIPKLPNGSFASWFLINLDFLLPYIVHFDNTIFLLLFVFEILGFMFSVCFLPFKQYEFILNIAHKIIILCYHFSQNYLVKKNLYIQIKFSFKHKINKTNKKYPHFIELYAFILKVFVIMLLLLLLLLLIINALMYLAMFSTPKGSK